MSRPQVVAPISERVQIFGRSFLNPTVHDVALTIAWAQMYSNTGTLDETHPMWAEYFAYSEFFRHLICTELSLRLDTEWDVINKIVGLAPRSYYDSESDFKSAHDLGCSKRFSDEAVPYIFERFEMIKLKITGRP